MRLFRDISSLFSDHLFCSYDTTQENLYMFSAKVSVGFVFTKRNENFNLDKRRLTGFLKGGGMQRGGGGGVKSSQIF